MSIESVVIVRYALAVHLDIHPTAVTESDRLIEDLLLDPLDLVLVALRLEEIAGEEFPIARLEGISTVRDFADIIDTWRSDGPDQDDLEDFRSPPSHPLRVPRRPESGILPRFSTKEGLARRASSR